MNYTTLTEFAGYAVGDTLQVSCEAHDARVVGTTRTRLLVEWPWLQVDEASENPWNGTMELPRDPEAYVWEGVPWRLEPDPSELGTGDPCFVGIPPTLVRVMQIGRHDPPADHGFLPRPEHVLGLCPIDVVDEEEAGFTLYLDGGEPIEIEVVSRAKDQPGFSTP
jgi:hypothetical protein